MLLINGIETIGKVVLANPVYDDNQVSISDVKIPPANAPTWREYDHGIVSGVEFPVLGFAVNEFIFFDVQTYHSMVLSSILDSHIHFMTPTDGTGDNFKFQLDVIAAPINGPWSVITGSPFTKETAISGDYSNSHRLTDIADMPAVNTTLSTIYKCKLTRIVASVDDYVGEIYMEFTDNHFSKNTLGSAAEFNKF